MNIDEKKKELNWVLIWNKYYERNVPFACMIPVFSLLACNSKKKLSLSGEEPVDIKDFIESFQPLDLPYQVADTSVSKKRKILR